MLGKFRWMRKLEFFNAHKDRRFFSHNSETDCRDCWETTIIDVYDECIKHAFVLFSWSYVRRRIVCTILEIQFSGWFGGEEENLPGRKILKHFPLKFWTWEQKSLFGKFLNSLPKWKGSECFNSPPPKWFFGSTNDSVQQGSSKSLARQPPGQFFQLIWIEWHIYSTQLLIIWAWSRSHTCENIQRQENCAEIVNSKTWPAHSHFGHISSKKCIFRIIHRLA